MKLIKDGLYIVSRVKWDQALVYIDSDFYCARIQISPGWCLSRPAWPTQENRRKWLAATDAVPVDPGELNEETRAKLSGFEMMTLA
jgi:hypothetical protein